MAASSICQTRSDQRPGGSAGAAGLWPNPRMSLDFELPAIWRGGDAISHHTQATHGMKYCGPQRHLSPRLASSSVLGGRGL